MFKSPLRRVQMSDAVFIDRADGWSRELVKLRSRGPGDLENAMRSVARDCDVDYGFLWSLRYRKNKIKEISVSVYLRLRQAWEAEKERQAIKHARDIEITKALCGSDNFAVVSAENVQRQIDRANDGEG